MTEDTTEVTDDDVSVAVLETKVEDLERQLRTARRGFVSKAVIRQAADYGISKFGFCNEIERTMTKFGLVGPDLVRLKIDLGQFGTTTLKVNAEEFELLDDDEARKRYLSGLITLKIEVSGGAVVGGGVHPPVLGYEEVAEDEPVPPTAVGQPPGYRWVYTSNEGRVRHLVSFTEGTGMLNRTAVCGSEGANFYGPAWQDTSARAEVLGGVPRNCQHCANWMNRNQR